jgi:hypothetical protein
MISSGITDIPGTTAAFETDEGTREILMDEEQGRER